MADVFVSYSRKDRAFVARLHGALTERGKDVWVDWKDIPPTADWREELATGIEAAQAFAFVMSPDSLDSEVCAFELAHAIEQGKRIVPVLWRESANGAAPEALADRNWIFLREQDDFAGAVDVLVAALETDLDWVRAHTRLLVRAQEWQRHARDSSYLLAGSDLRDAEGWLARERPEIQPAANPLQREYVAASRRAASSRQRRLLIGVSTALAVSVALGVFSLVELRIAQDQRATARSRSLSASAVANLGTDPELSALLALEALERKVTSEAEDTLRRALGEIQARAAFHHAAAVNTVAFSPAGRALATTSDDHTAALWDWRTGRRLALLSGHTSVVRSLDFGPGGRMVVTGGHDGSARLWDSASARQMAVLQGPRGPTTVNFDRSGRYVLAGTGSGAALIWSVRTHRRLALVDPHAGAVLGQAMSPTGRIAAVAYADGSVRILSLPGGRVRRVIHASHRALSVVAFSPDGRVLGAAGDDGRVRLWTPGGRLLRTMRGPGRGATVPYFAFSPDGSRLVTVDATALNQNTATLWSTRTGRRLVVLRGHGAPVNDAAFSSDGRLVATASSDGTARVWRTADGGPVLTLRGHQGPVLAVRFAASDRYLATASADHTARVWESTPGHTLATMAQPGLISSDSSRDGRELVSAGATSNRALLWSTASGRLQERLDVGPARGAGLTASVFSPDSRHVAVAGAHDTIIFPTPEAGSGRRVHLPVGTAGIGFSLNFSPDSARVVVGGADGSVSVWQAASGRLVARIRRAAGPIISARFSPGEQTVAFTQAGADPQLWRLGAAGPPSAARRGSAAESAAATVPLHGDSGQVTDAMFSPDGRLVATASKDGSARLWAAGGGRQLRVLNHAESVDGVDFSHDGRRLVSASADGTAKVWDAASGANQLVLRHSQGVFEAHFSPDDRVVVTGSNDGTARLWDSTSGQGLAALEGHTGAAGAYFDGLGRVVSQGATDNTVRVYACDVCGSLSQLVATAHRLLLRGLSPSERKRFLAGL